MCDLPLWCWPEWRTLLSSYEIVPFGLLFSFQAFNLSLLSPFSKSSLTFYTCISHLPIKIFNFFRSNDGTVVAEPMV